MDSYETDETVKRATEFLDRISRPFALDDCKHLYVHVDEQGIRRLVSIPPNDDEK
jgi:hypothetical protein